MNKRIISFLLATILVFNFCVSSIFASSDIDATLYGNSSKIENNDKYSSALFGDGWQRKYIITILDIETDEKVELKIPAINNGEINEQEILESLPQNKRLIEFKVNENPKYEEQVGVRFVETIFDIGNFAMSIVEFFASPSFSNGFNVVVDGLSVVFPGVPSVTGVKRMIQSSNKLADALRWGVHRYDGLVDAKQGIARFSHLQAHHIIEKRFIPAFPEIPTTFSMFSVNIPYNDHLLITNKMQGLIAYGSDYSLMSRNYIKSKMIQGYSELYQQTGDSLFEFLGKFVEESDKFHHSTRMTVPVPNYFDTY